MDRPGTISDQGLVRPALNQARVERESSLPNQTQSLRVGMFRIEYKIAFFREDRGGYR